MDDLMVILKAYWIKVKYAQHNKGRPNLYILSYDNFEDIGLFSLIENFPVFYEDITVFSKNLNDGKELFTNLLNLNEGYILDIKNKFKFVMNGYDPLQNNPFQYTNYLKFFNKFRGFNPNQFKIIDILNDIRSHQIVLKQSGEHIKI